MKRLLQEIRGVTEACCLIALIVVPLFFNIFAMRVFEMGKTSLLQSLLWLPITALVVAFLLDRIVHRRNATMRLIRPKDILTRPMLLPVSLFVAAFILSTIFSLVPHISFWGSFLRAEGSYAMLTYPVLFACLLWALNNSPSRVERAIQLIVLVSIPLALYGILQKAGLDDELLSGKQSRRVFGMIGNPIFFAAFFCMIIPVTLRQAIVPIQNFPAHLGGKVRHIFLSTIYVVIFLVQVLALYLSGSRGPLLALAIGMLFFVALTLMYWGKRRLVLAAIGFPLLVGVALLLTQATASQAVAKGSVLGRYNQLFNPHQKTSKVRIIIWQGVTDLLALNQPVQFPDGSVDRFDRIRPLVGYGSEQIMTATSRSYSPTLRHVEKQNNMPDRSHNETWDTLVQFGSLGLIAYVLFFASFFYWSLRWMGLMESRTSLFVLCMLISTVAVTSGAVYFGGVPFLGLGMPCGMMLGLFLYLVMTAFRDRKKPRDPAASPSLSFENFSLIAALVAGTLAHFAEIQVGISTVSSRTMLWTYAALLCVAGKYIADRQQATLAEEKVQLPTRSFAGAWIFIVVALVATVGFDMVSNYKMLHWMDKEPSNSLMNRAGIMLATSWILACAIPVLSLKGAVGFLNRLKSFGWILGMTGFISFLYLSWHAKVQTYLTFKTYQGPADLEGQEYGFAILLTRYVVILLIAAIAGGLFMVDRRRNRAPWRPIQALAGVTALVLAGIAIGQWHVRPMHADMCYKSALGFAIAKNWKQAIAHHEIALDIVPNMPRYHYGYAQTLHKRAQRISNNPGRRDKFMEQAVFHSTRAHELSPLRSDHLANLGVIYRSWATMSSERKQRRQRAKTSDRYYHDALTLHPNFVFYWCERAVVNFRLLGRPKAVERLLHRALKLDDQYPLVHQLLGDHYSSLASGYTDETIKTEILHRAAYHYEYAFRVAGKSGLRESYRTHLAASKAFARLENVPAAMHHAISAHLEAPDEQKDNIRAWMDHLEEERRKETDKT